MEQGYKRNVITSLSESRHGRYAYYKSHPYKKRQN